MRFLCIILRVLRPDVSAYNVYITNKFQTTIRGDFKWHGGKLLRLSAKVKRLQEYVYDIVNVHFGDDRYRYF